MITHDACNTAGSDCAKVDDTVYFPLAGKIELDLFET
jgi:hypothetical protein